MSKRYPFLQAEANQRNVSLSGLALAWVMSNPLVTAPIVGPRKPEHLKPVEEALNVKLSEAERENIGMIFSLRS